MNDPFKDAADLDELLDLMREHDDPNDGEQWMYLPTFGGEEPNSSECVWSWDAKRVLVGRCGSELAIIAR